MEGESGDLGESRERLGWVCVGEDGGVKKAGNVVGGRQGIFSGEASEDEEGGSDFEGRSDDDEWVRCGRGRRR